MLYLEGEKHIPFCVVGQQTQQNFCNLLENYETRVIFWSKHTMVATNKQDLVVKKCVIAGWNGSSQAGAYMGDSSPGWASKGYYRPEMVPLDVTFNMPDPISQLIHRKNMEPHSKITQHGLTSGGEHWIRIPGHKQEVSARQRW